MKGNTYPVSFQKILGRIFNLLVFMAAILLALSSFQLTACSTTSGKQVAEPAAVTEPAKPAEDWGIEITSVRLSAHDYMVDFRYRVLDAKKADKLFAKEAKPYLVDQKTGKVLAVPRTAKVGPLMSSYQHKQGRIYWMFFGNRGKLVKAGDEVSVVIGEFRADNITVQ